MAPYFGEFGNISTPDDNDIGIAAEKVVPSHHPFVSKAN
jgi:hypothetical protein